MPAGVRFQQLTPVGRASSNQPTTIVRLMSPSNSTGIRATTNQQQFIQLNTNKQQQPLVIKAITTSNRQQQPILLAANTQQKTILPQTQQQVLVLNQNTFNNSQGQQQTKFTFQMTNNDNNQQEPTTKDNNIPQLDGTVDDQVRLSSLKKTLYSYCLFSLYKMVQIYEILPVQQQMRNLQQIIIKRIQQIMKILMVGI
jgi:hypothetical protein